MSYTNTHKLPDAEISPNQNIIFEKLIEIQQSLKVPKDNFNSFAKFKYRTTQNILESVKPLCHKAALVVLLTDRLIGVDGRFYVEATARLQGASGEISVCALAREQALKKGMDEAQITGGASSYARKTALCGLFAIDDSIDIDQEDAPEKKPVMNALQARKPPVADPVKEYEENKEAIIAKKEAQQQEKIKKHEEWNELKASATGIPNKVDVNTTKRDKISEAHYHDLKMRVGEEPRKLKDHLAIAHQKYILNMDEVHELKSIAEKALIDVIKHEEKKQ